MANATFTPGDEKQDEKLNPSQQDYDQRFNDIAQQEEKGTFDDIANNYDQTADSSQEDANIAKAREAENAGETTGGWNNKVDDSKDGKSRGDKVKGWFKKASPLIGTGGAFGIGGFILIALTSPSLLIVQMKETMVQKFNTQLSSLEARSTKLMTAKLKETTSGICGSKISIKCKYATMSKKQVAKFKAAGIDVEGGEAIAGRTKPTVFKMGDLEVKASDFASVMKTNTAFRSAVHAAYNPKYAGFVGKAWSNVAAKFKISKKAPELDAKADEAKAKAKINDISKEGTTDSSSSKIYTADGEECKSNCVSEADANNANTAQSDLESAGKSGEAATDVKTKLGNISGSASVGNFFKVTGAIDNACQVVGAVNTLSYAAKAIRAAQMVRYAMIFFSVADAIKAGDSPDPEDVTLLGNTLTATVADPNDKTKTAVGSATDSFGYKYAAYGDASASSSSMDIANRFTAGGGFVGQLDGMLNTVYSFIPGGKSSARATCGTLANPLVQGVSIVAGIGSLFIPGANAAKIAISAASSIAVGIVLAILPGLLADIVAGTTTENIAGEESGNAMTSGAGALMSDSLAAENGNAPMTKEDAIAYNDLQTQTTNEYIAEEVATMSPFDATSQYTFLGSIVNSLLPLQSSSNPLTTITSFLSTAVQDIIPSSSALTTEQYAKSLDVCSDADMVEANMAADPFCNVIRGIPPKYLDKDPFVVVDELVNSGFLTADGERTDSYDEFVNLCIQNDTPLGYADATNGFNPDDLTKCEIKSDGTTTVDADKNNVDLYLNYVDQRVQLGLDGDDVDEGTGSTSVANTEIDEANLFKDSTDISCAAGTVDAGVSVGYKDGKPVNIRLCSLPNTIEGGEPAVANSRVSGAVYAMFEQMRTDLGLEKITINDSYRTMAEQQQARADVGDQAATPGYSNHQMGLAFDINMGSANGGNATSYVKNTNSSYPGSKPWDWLVANASNYHYSQYPPEGWHWSVNGG